MSKRAILLAGGKGMRLRPYTASIPKPLMPLGKYAILEVIIRQLVHQGFDHITLAINHQGALIQKHIGHGEKWNVCIDYSEEMNPLGTIGPLSLIHDLPQNFLVMNSDILTDFDYADFYEEHITANSLFSIAAFQRKETQAYGVIDIDETGNLRDFREKPVMHVNVSMGVYMARRDIVERIPHNQPFGFDQLVHRLLSEKKAPKVSLHKGHWLDIGCPEDYKRAEKVFEEYQDYFLPSECVRLF